MPTHLRKPLIRLRVRFCFRARRFRMTPLTIGYGWTIRSIEMSDSARWRHGSARYSGGKAFISRFGPPTVLPLSGGRPYRTRLGDATRRAVRAAEAAGQTTAARRLLRRVGQRGAGMTCQPDLT